jgi:hypothetical protein
MSGIEQFKNYPPISNTIDVLNLSSRIEWEERASISGIRCVWGDENIFSGKYLHPPKRSEWVHPKRGGPCWSAAKVF